MDDGSAACLHFRSVILSFEYALGAYTPRKALRIPHGLQQLKTREHPVDRT